MIITLGTDARRGHVKTAEKFSEKLATQINMLNGNHRSFMKPWEDVNLLLKTLFMKIKIENIVHENKIGSEMCLRDFGDDI